MLLLLKVSSFYSISPSPQLPPSRKPFLLHRHLLAAVVVVVGVVVAIEIVVVVVGRQEEVSLLCLWLQPPPAQLWWKEVGLPSLPSEAELCGW